MRIETTKEYGHTPSHDDMEGKYLTFQAEAQTYALPIREVVQIVGMQTITPVPEYPDYVKGLINLRQTVIPVIDTRIRLKKVAREYDERTCIIVCKIKDLDVGFIVDQVEEVSNIENHMISPPPQFGQQQNYLSGIGKYNEKIVLILEVEKLLGEEDWQRLSQDVEGEAKL